MKASKRFQRGTIAYLLLCAAIASSVQVTSFGGVEVRVAQWGVMGTSGILTSLQEFIILSCGGIGLYTLVSWLWEAPQVMELGGSSAGARQTPEPPNPQVAKD